MSNQYGMPNQVSAQFLQTVMAVMMAVAMGAWAFSLVKKAVKGEEVAFPLGKGGKVPL